MAKIILLSLGAFLLIAMSVYLTERAVFVIKRAGKDYDKSYTSSNMSLIILASVGSFFSEVLVYNLTGASAVLKINTPLGNFPLIYLAWLLAILTGGMALFLLFDCSGDSGTFNDYYYRSSTSDKGFKYGTIVCVVASLFTQLLVVASLWSTWQIGIFASTIYLSLVIISFLLQRNLPLQKLRPPREYSGF
jgi:hypothetical protein